MQILISNGKLLKMFVWNFMSLRKTKMPKLTRDFRFQPRPMPELTIKEIPDGCIGLGDKPSDYKLTEWLLDALPTLYQQDEIIYEYNQFNQKRSQKSCTLFSPIGAISDLFNVEIPLDTIKAWDTDSYNHWRMKDNWWYVAKGVEFICDKWNESKYAKEYWKVAFYSIDLKDNALVKWILDKRYTICVGFQWNANYSNDKNKDGILNQTTFGSYTYGHAVGAIWSTNYPARIKDNYKWIKYNIYEVEHEFSDLSCYYDKGYVITKVAEDAIEEVKRLNEFRTNLLNAIEINSAMWHQTNDKNFQSILHYTNEKLRKKVKDCDEQLKKYL